ncbi:MAG: tetratricopeptide repeat protein [Planctomycetota bacterium]|nr:MAG: tetratricopeptide repeat protein [Planctomycetota bacterium]
MTEATRRARKRRRLFLIVAGVVVAASALGGWLLQRRASEPGDALEGAGAGQAGALAVDKALQAARTWLDHGQPDKAERILRATLEQAPSDPQVQALLAETLLAQGKMRDAKVAYEAAIASSSEPDAKLHFAAGLVASELGELEEAANHFRAAQSLDPADPQAPVYLAAVERSLGNLEAAKAALLRAVKLAPDEAQPWGQLAEIALQENKLSLALQHIRKARALQPEAVVWRLIEARILRRDNRPEEAVRLLLALGREEILRNPAVLEELGRCYGLLKRPGEAAQLYADAAERKPDDAQLLLETARWWKRAGVADAARVYASRAAALGSEQARRFLESLDADPQDTTAADGGDAGSDG